jgi:hypothetical protein
MSGLTLVHTLSAVLILGLVAALMGPEVYI